MNTKLWWIRERTTYGGALNYRKVARPFESKKLVHAVFKANLGKGIYFSRSRRSVQRVLDKCARKYQIKLRDTAINKDHIHLLFSSPDRDSFTKFLRLFAAELGRQYSRVYSRFGLKKPVNFWQGRPFTRLVSWGRQSVRALRDYFQKNREECAGIVKYQPRKHRLDDFLIGWNRVVSDSS